MRVDAERDTLGTAISAVILALALACPPLALGETPDPVANQARVAAARQLLRHAASEAAALQRSDERAVFRNLARSQARAGDVAGALASLAQVPPNLPDVQNTAFTLQDIAAARARAGDVNGALQTLASLPAGYPRERAMQAIAEAQAEAGDVSGALKTADSVGPGRAREGMQAVIARAQAQAGDVVGALKTAALLHDDEILGQVLVQIGMAQVKAGDIGGAIQTVGLAGLQHSDDDVEGMLAFLYALKKDFARARQIAKSLKGGSGVMVLVAVPGLQAQAGDVEGALKTAEDIPDVRWHGTSWRAVALQGVVAALADRGDLVRARLIGNSLVDRSMRAGAKTAVAQAQARSGDVPGALQTLAAMSDAESRSSAVHTVALGLARRGDVGAALRVAGSLSDAEGRRRLAAAIAQTQADRGDLAGARTTAAAIDEEGSRRSAMWRIAVAAAKGGDPSHVLSAVTAQGGSPYVRVMQLLGVVEELLRPPDQLGFGLAQLPGLEFLDPSR